MVYDETSLDIQAGVTGFNWDDINLKWHLNERVRAHSIQVSKGKNIIYFHFVELEYIGWNAELLKFQ